MRGFESIDLVDRWSSAQKKRGILIYKLRINRVKVPRLLGGAATKGWKEHRWKVLDYYYAKDGFDRPDVFFLSVIPCRSRKQSAILYGDLPMTGLVRKRPYVKTSIIGSEDHSLGLIPELDNLVYWIGNSPDPNVVRKFLPN
ncbi:hydrogenase [Striga asiatica]|uniref:Hydrogenase n=1 Tax=Striga asiatica TaxID=4170 RepID=A0A5A7PZ54_STRAF|nr:hydrogenase [Striga asiatica]